jgi:hypothetical protein
MSIEAMKLALEALDRNWDGCVNSPEGEAITALNAAIEAAKKQEPVAWCVLEPWLSGKFEAQDCFSDVALDANVGWVPLYTTPPAAQPAPVQEPRHTVQSNGRHSPLLTHMMNSRTTPPAAQRPLVWLSQEDEQEIKDRCTTVACVLRAVKAKLKGKNT